nr:hemerythrin domain-containing protein [Geothrix oryzisoli]
MAADHGEIDALFREARAAMDREARTEAHRAIDRIWMRLAVHIRAEHTALFPVLVEAWPDLAASLRGLREDHDVFMATLASAVNALKGPDVDWASVKASVETVRRRLIPHNALEEERIYPLAGQLEEGPRARLDEAVARELAALPGRYGAR